MLGVAPPDGRVVVAATRPALINVVVAWLIGPEGRLGGSLIQHSTSMPGVSGWHGSNYGSPSTSDPGPTRTKDATWGGWEQAGMALTFANDPRVLGRNGTELSCPLRHTVHSCPGGGADERIVPGHLGKGG